MTYADNNIILAGKQKKTNKIIKNIESATNVKGLRLNKNEIEYTILNEEQKRQFTKLEVITKNDERYNTILRKPEI